MADDVALELFIQETKLSLQRIESNLQRSDAQQRRLEESLLELTRTIRGHNGDAGLVTQVAVLRDSLTKHYQDVADDKKKTVDKKEDDDKMWVVERLILPIIIPAVTAGIIYFLLDVIPHVSTATVP